MKLIGLENLIQIMKKLMHFPIIFFISVGITCSSCVSQTHRHTHMNRELKGINRGTHCKISDSFRIEIMAAYSRMHIPNVLKRVLCETSDLRPFFFHFYLNIKSRFF